MIGLKISFLKFDLKVFGFPKNLLQFSSKEFHHEPSKRQKADHLSTRRAINPPSKGKDILLSSQSSSLRNSRRAPVRVRRYAKLRLTSAPSSQRRSSPSSNAEPQTSYKRQRVVTVSNTENESHSSKRHRVDPVASTDENISASTAQSSASSAERSHPSQIDDPGEIDDHKHDFAPSNRLDGTKETWNEHSISKIIRNEMFTN